ncbi:hypothetical protein FMEAI12_7390012 [Parafrankia sp. Ea1.12]|nr:hypothetical protein FMEAI12_7390012 [Parafrankia sp. Ea1.12]
MGPLRSSTIIRSGMPEAAFCHISHNGTMHRKRHFKSMVRIDV